MAISCLISPPLALARLLTASPRVRNPRMYYNRRSSHASSLAHLPVGAPFHTLYAHTYMNEVAIALKDLLCIDSLGIQPTPLQKAMFRGTKINSAARKLRSGVVFLLGHSAVQTRGNEEILFAQ